MYQRCDYLAVLVCLLAVGAAQGQTPKPKPKPSMKGVTSTAAAPAASGTKVLFRADRAATLAIDGEAAGQLEAGQMKAVVLGPGEHLIESRLVSDAKVRVEERLTIAAGQAQFIHELSFAAAEAAARRWVLVDGLQWVSKDNGFYVDWNAAKRYCDELSLDGHHDWRLPTIDELQKMYDPSIGAVYKIRGGITLTDCCPWSSTLKDWPSSAWNFNFRWGERAAIELDYGYLTRALCVRVPRE